MRRKLFALEDMAEEVSLNPAELEDEADEALDDVEDDSGEVEELSTAIEEAYDEIDNLEDIHDTMEESVENGEGLDETSAEIADIAVESICNRLGMKYRNVIPATESFSSPTSRVTATKIAMEGIKDTISKAWGGIKNAFSKLWERTKAFYAKLSQNCSKLEAYLQSLESEVDAIDDSRAGQAISFEAGVKGKVSSAISKSQVKGLGVEGKVDASSVSIIFQNTKALLAAAKEVGAESASFSEFITKEHQNDRDAYQNVLKKGKAYTDFINRTFSKIKKVKSAKVNARGEAGEVVNYGPFFGSKVLSITESEKTREEDEDSQGYSLKTVSLGFDIDPSHKIESISSATTLKKNDAKKILAGAIEIVKEVAEYKAIESSVNKGVSKIQSYKEIVFHENITGAKSGVSEDEKLLPHFFHLMNKEIKQLNNVLSVITVPVAGLSFSTAKAAGNYIKWSIAHNTAQSSKEIEA